LREWEEKGTRNGLSGVGRGGGTSGKFEGGESGSISRRGTRRKFNKGRDRAATARTLPIQLMERGENTCVLKVE